MIRLDPRAKIPLTLAAIVVFCAALLYALSAEPVHGDVDAPAHRDVSVSGTTTAGTYHTRHAYRDAHTPNMVTVVLADYRGFDTLGETAVVFCGAVCVMLILRAEAPGVIRRASPSLVVRVTCRIVAPVIQVFGLYVLFHGHYSPGGGFQGGVMIAASIILLRMSHGTRATQPLLPTSLATRGAALGALIFLAIGALALLYGGEYLDYGRVPLSDDPAMRRSHGILLIEVGVALACITAIVSIYDDLARARGHGDGRDV